jgi:hypothetical protein
VRSGIRVLVKIMMATVGHWRPDGIMDEEYLFWDNQEL